MNEIKSLLQFLMEYFVPLLCADQLITSPGRAKKRRTGIPVRLSKVDYCSPTEVGFVLRKNRLFTFHLVIDLHLHNFVGPVKAPLVP